MDIKGRYLDKKANYDRFPETAVSGFELETFSSIEAILDEIHQKMYKKKVLVVDSYPGTDDEKLIKTLSSMLSPECVINSEEIFYDGDRLTELMSHHLTDDRVRGRLYKGEVEDFIDPEKLLNAKKLVAGTKGTILICGFAASLIAEGDVKIYSDLARWEIQLRYRKGLPNYKQNNRDEDILLKYKRAFFIEWRIADKHKVRQLSKMDYYLDTNNTDNPVMITRSAFGFALSEIVKKPFRLVPYFDPGVWGGQWMKEVCNLPQHEKNYAWSFDGVPEENSLYFRFGDARLEMPAMNLTLLKPIEFLGERNYARFGAEFPIRFDFLDTMEGQNLSLQVHPTTDYIQKKFGMHYTQDESYYILDAKADAGVYLGVKNDVDPQNMIDALREAQKGDVGFDAEKYVNLFPAKKHDHFLIPAGTVHCSSKNCMVLEISATPYIFTFKLWDWDRVGLDGLPRPIHIEDGKEVMRFDRDTDWVQKELINRFEEKHSDKDCTVTKTGLHELEFIETEIITTKTSANIKSNDEFSILNLVDGIECVVESPTNLFEPFIVHYVETFIMPAKAGDFTIKSKKGEDIKVLRARVRQG